ncbi:leucine-rich repeat-containing G-protein coupled receptor 4-like [Uranotaenia lowii]|uniref:leucine-rich repeat-containing G-protein coupled receptor 4-like n=1 Tax=Uranotaenia lowii TaxID=190385 RepID=UPI00247A869B|nr:leucine-rich repeat-containing G-protein coupled receptor 4-like [Uranotaenia lowii]XP_055609243.1 leucine-rich repeat-containing G-protein coupled receptor 4-like [Uranotaenia lowii]
MKLNLALLVVSFTVLNLQSVENRAVPHHRQRNANQITHFRNIINNTINESLPNDAVSLGKLPNATELILESFSMARCEESFFYRIPHTRYLTFMYGSIPLITFWSMKLESLAVFQTNLSTFEVLPVVNTALKALQISRNRLNTISRNLRYLEGLTSLDLSQNEIEQVDLDVFSKMVHLKKLDLSVNRITSIDSSPDLTLTMLKDLMISHNLLQEFPRFPEAFPKLQTIRLMGNRWTCAWVSQARRDIMDNRIVTFGLDYICSEFRQGGLCCYGDLEGSSTTTEAAILREGPLMVQIQKLAVDLSRFPLDLENDQIVELLTQNSTNGSERTLIGVRHDKVEVFF